MARLITEIRDATATDAAVEVLLLPGNTDNADYDDGVLPEVIPVDFIDRDEAEDVVIQVEGDEIEEGDETFTLQLQNAVAATIDENADTAVVVVCAGPLVLHVIGRAPHLRIETGRPQPGCGELQRIQQTWPKNSR